MNINIISTLEKFQLFQIFTNVLRKGNQPMHTAAPAGEPEDEPLTLFLVQFQESRHYRWFNLPTGRVIARVKIIGDEALQLQISTESPLSVETVRQSLEQSLVNSLVGSDNLTVETVPSFLLNKRWE